MAAAAVRAIAGGIYYLSGVLVKAETKEIAKRLIAKGFRAATEGMKNSRLPIKNVTESNIITFLVRGLRDAIKKAKELREPQKINLKDGRPIARKKPGEGNLLGNRGQSEFARKYGPRKMGGFGPVKSTRVREARDLKLVKAKRAKAKAESSAKPVQSTLKNTQREYKPTPKNPEVGGIKLPTPAATIAGLIAAAAIGRVAYDAYIEKHNPTPSQIRAAEKKIKAEVKNNDTQPSKDSSLVGDAGTESKRQKEKKRIELAAKKEKERLRKEKKRIELAAKKEKEKLRKEKERIELAAKKTKEKLRKEKERKAAELAAQRSAAAAQNTPSRKETIRKEVFSAAVGGREGLKKIREDAKKKALTEVLNKKIASKNSTVAKEKARAIDGEYKSLASAKKAGSLYYMHKGKELRAAITEEETRTARRRIKGEAMKKIAEGK